MRIKNLFHYVIALIMLALFGGAVLFLQPTDAEAGIYSESSEVTYKEYWIDHSEFTAGCDNTNGNKWYIEPDSDCSKTLDFSIPDNIDSATKVEIYIDLWRNRAEPAAQFSLNGGPAHTPNVGDDRSRTPYVAELPLDELGELESGSNSITFSAIDGKAYHVHDVAFRVYGPISGTDVVAPNGALGTVTADNGTFNLMGGIPNQTLTVNGDQLVLTANVTTADTKFVEFHAYYQGYDEDNDGEFQDWHNRGRNNWHPGGEQDEYDENPHPEWGGTIDHVGTATVNGTGVYAVTWDLPHIVNQSDVRFKIRLVDAAGNVRDAAGGQSSTFTLARTGETAVFLIPNFQDIGLHRNSSSNTEPQPGAVDTISYLMELPDDFTDYYDTAYIIGSFYRNSRISINPSVPYVDNDSDFDFYAFPNALPPLQNGSWTLSIEEIPIGDLVSGENEIRFDYFGKGYGGFIEKPGPMIVLKGSNALGVDNDAPTAYGHNPQNGATSVDADTPVQIHLFDPSNIKFDASLTMSVDGTPVTPDVTSAGPTTAALTYTPSSSFTAGDVIAVSVHACDTLNNCMTENYSLTIKVPAPNSDVQSDDFNVCALDTSIWTLEHQVAGLPPEFNGEQMLLSVPSGTGYNHDNAPRIMQDVSNTDFEIEVKFDSAVTEKTQRQGILIEQDDDNYVQIEFLYKGDKTKISIQTYAAGVQTYLEQSGGPNTLNGPPWYVQVLREGDTWTIRYSADGIVWKKPVDPFDFALTVDRVGIFIGNSSSDPAHTGVVDYFFNTFDPIDPEDGTALLLPTSVVGDGIVVPDAACGNPVSLTATADPGWSFSNWSGSPLGGTGDETNPAPENIAFSSGDAVTAVFTRNEYTVDIDIMGESVRDGSLLGVGGTVNKDPNQSIYYYDDSVTLTATPDPGWVFTGWSGDLSGSNLSETITVQQSQNIVATFTQQQYNVAAATDITGGSITISPASGPYVYGDSITLTATPDDADWHFVNWSGDVSGTQNPFTTTVIAQDMTIDAVFSDTYTLFLPLVISD